MSEVSALVHVSFSVLPYRGGSTHREIGALVYITQWMCSLRGPVFFESSFPSLCRKPLPAGANSKGLRKLIFEAE